MAFTHKTLIFNLKQHQFCIFCWRDMWPASNTRCLDYAQYLLTRLLCMASHVCQWNNAMMWLRFLSTINRCWWRDHFVIQIILSSCVISWSPISHPKWTFTVGLCNWPKKKNLHIKRKYVGRTVIRSEISWQRGSEDMKTHLLCIAGSCWCPCVAWWSWPAGCWSSWGAPRRSRPSSCQTSRDFAGSEEWKVIEMQNLQLRQLKLIEQRISSLPY